MAYNFTLPALSDSANIRTALTNFGASIETSVDSEFADGATEYRGKSTLSNVAGTVTSVGKIYVQSTQPSGAVVGDIWMW
jgi:hypothetical protein